MGLSCECPCGDEYDAVWYYNEPGDYSKLPKGRRKRCCSCRTLINIGANVTKFSRWRESKPDSIEEEILGEGAVIKLANWYQCEKCSDLYFSLEELGFCIEPGDDMRDLIKEYAEEYGHNS